MRNSNLSDFEKVPIWVYASVYCRFICAWLIVRLSTSPGLPWVLTGILVGILVDHMTHKSGSPATGEDPGMDFIVAGTRHEYPPFAHLINYLM